MNTREVAIELGTKPEILRQFLRDHEAYKNVGSGSQYSFEASDIAELRTRFNAWKGNKKPRSGQVSRKKDQKSDVITVSQMRSSNPRDREAIRAAAEARVDRLERLLKSRGLHISQMKDRTA